MGFLIFAAFVAGTLFSGCSKSNEKKAPAEAGPPVTDLTQPDLPPLDAYLPLLDEGKLEMAPPKDWAVAPRSNKFIIRFQSDPSAPYPTVVVTAEDCAQFRNVTQENIGQYQKFVAQEMKAAGRSGTIQAGRIGQMVGVLYQRRVKVKDSLGTILDQLCFDTVCGGRRYKFQLWASSDVIDLAKPAFLSILNGTKFSSVEEVQEELVQGEPAPGDAKPAGEKPTTPPPAASQEKPQAAPDTHATTSPQPKPQAQPAPGPKPEAQAEGAKPQQSPPAEKEKEKEQAQKKEQPKEEKKDEKKGKSVEDVLEDVDSLLK